MFSNVFKKIFTGSSKDKNIKDENDLPIEPDDLDNDTDTDEVEITNPNAIISPKPLEPKAKTSTTTTTKEMPAVLTSNDFYNSEDDDDDDHHHHKNKTKNHESDDDGDYIDQIMASTDQKKQKPSSKVTKSMNQFHKDIGKPKSTKSKSIESDTESDEATESKDKASESESEEEEEELTDQQQKFYDWLNNEDILVLDDMKDMYLISIPSIRKETEVLFVAIFKDNQNSKIVDDIQTVLTRYSKEFNRLKGKTYSIVVVEYSILLIEKIDELKERYLKHSEANVLDEIRDYVTEAVYRLSLQPKHICHIKVATLPKNYVKLDVGKYQSLFPDYPDSLNEWIRKYILAATNFETCKGFICQACSEQKCSMVDKEGNSCCNINPEFRVEELICFQRLREGTFTEYKKEQVKNKSNTDLYTAFDALNTIYELQSDIENVPSLNDTQIGQVRKNPDANKIYECILQIQQTLKAQQQDELSTQDAIITQRLGLFASKILKEEFVSYRQELTNKIKFVDSYQNVDVKVRIATEQKKKEQEQEIGQQVSVFQKQLNLFSDELGHQKKSKLAELIENKNQLKRLKQEEEDKQKIELNIIETEYLADMNKALELYNSTKQRLEVQKQNRIQFLQNQKNQDIEALSNKATNLEIDLRSFDLALKEQYDQRFKTVQVEISQVKTEIENKYKSLIANIEITVYNEKQQAEQQLARLKLETQNKPNKLKERIEHVMHFVTKHSLEPEHVEPAYTELQNQLNQVFVNEKTSFQNLLK